MKIDWADKVCVAQVSGCFFRSWFQFFQLCVCSCVFGGCFCKEHQYIDDYEYVYINIFQVYLFMRLSCILMYHTEPVAVQMLDCIYIILCIYNTICTCTIYIYIVYIYSALHLQ